MLAQVTHWILLAAVAQGAPESSLLKVVPADVDVAIRTRGMEKTRDDVLAMLKTMNAEWADMATGVLTGGLDQVRASHGEHAVTEPFVTFIRLGEAGADNGPPPFAVVVAAKDTKAAIKELLGGKDPELKKEEGGYESFDAPDGGGTWYAASREELLAFGSSRSLIADIAKHTGKTLDTKLTSTEASTFLAGDVGVYVNAAALATRFADQIEQGRQTFMAAMEQAGKQAGNAGMGEFLKEFYGGMFDSIKYADALTLNLAPSEKGLHLTGFIKLKADSDLARSIPKLQSERLGSLGKLPRGDMTYVYMNVSAKSFDSFQGMSLKMFEPEGKPSPDIEKARAELHALGRIESLGAVKIQKTMETLTDVKVDDPKKFIDASVSLLRAMSKLPSGVYKDFKVETESRTIAGMSVTHVAAVLDVDKLAALAGNNPAQLETFKSMFGDGVMNYWYARDGKRIIQVIAPRWEVAQSKIEAYLKGEEGIGQTSGFQSARSALPDKASFLMLFSMQGLTEMMARQFGALTKNPDLKPPADMPKEPAYLGLSLTPHPTEGYRFDLVLPSSVGTVVAKGLVPLFQGMAPPGAN